MNREIRPTRYLGAQAAARTGLHALCAAAIFLTVAAPLVARAGPFVPTTDDTVLERLPVARDPGIDLRRLNAVLARTPDNLDLAAEVARRDLDYGGPRFDPRYTGYAQAALAPWWIEADPPIPVRLLRATIRQRNHDFDAALIDLDAVLARQPRNPSALLTRAAVRLVRADYAGAAEDCGILLREHGGLAAAGCVQAVTAVSGNAMSAEATLSAAYARAAATTAIDIRVWVLVTLAETAARLDDAEEAERRFRDALALRPDDGYTLAAFTDFLLDQHRPQEVSTLLADRTAIDPLLLRLAIAEHAVRPTTASPHAEALADRYATARARGDTVNSREEARFILILLAEPKRALTLALDNWRVQREPADARILLEAALAVGDRNSAGPALRWLEQTGYDHPQFVRLAAALRALPHG